MVFGSQQNFYDQERLNLNLENIKLYDRLQKLESNLKAWFALWKNTYLQNTIKMTKWQKNDKMTLTPGSIVLIKDHFNSENGYNAIGEIESCISPRTFCVRYVKKQLKTDKKGQIIKPAVMDTLTRPNTSLVYLCHTNNDNETFNLDPYQPSEKTLKTSFLSEDGIKYNETQNIPIKEISDSPDQEMSDSPNTKKILVKYVSDDISRIIDI